MLKRSINLKEISSFFFFRKIDTIVFVFPVLHQSIEYLPQKVFATTVIIRKARKTYLILM